MPGIDGLRAALEALPLVVDDVRVNSHRAILPGYPNGPRPTSTVVIRGAGRRGSGEHVGWTDQAHAAFRTSAADVATGSWKLGEWAAALGAIAPYDRAALEAAAIDLALRQRGVSLFEFAGAAAQPARYVVSFSRVADPVAEARAKARSDVELKIDADPDWPLETWSGLARLGRVAVVDFKLHGLPADHERACRCLPDAWIEDPGPSGTAQSPLVAARVSADAAVTSIAALEAIDPPPAAVNIKAARMGSVLEAIACLELAAARALPAYIGGMFEIGVARTQSLALAALSCADGPNDIAPLTGETPRGRRLVADADAPGFGGKVAP